VVVEAQVDPGKRKLKRMTMKRMTMKRGMT
jgi:hypothetical protein